jgi:hypothetical protein
MLNPMSERGRHDHGAIIACSAAGAAQRGRHPYQRKSRYNRIHDYIRREV